jgi:hypothetical protein
LVEIGSDIGVDSAISNHLSSDDVYSRSRASVNVIVTSIGTSPMTVGFMPIVIVFVSFLSSCGIVGMRLNSMSLDGSILIFFACIDPVFVIVISIRFHVFGLNVSSGNFKVIFGLFSSCILFAFSSDCFAYPIASS